MSPGRGRPPSVERLLSPSSFSRIDSTFENKKHEKSNIYWLYIFLYIYFESGLNRFSRKVKLF